MSKIFFLSQESKYAILKTNKIIGKEKTYLVKYWLDLIYGIYGQISVMSF